MGIETIEASAKRKSPLGILWQIFLAAVVVAMVVAYGSSYQVSEGRAAVVTRFGQPVRVVPRPGLHWKSRKSGLV